MTSQPLSAWVRFLNGRTIPARVRFLNGLTGFDTAVGFCLIYATVGDQIGVYKFLPRGKRRAKLPWVFFLYSKENKQ